MKQYQPADYSAHRPLGLTLLGGLYLFFFLVSTSTYGNPFPFMGVIYSGTAARALVLMDSLVCLYLFIGILKRQLLTWYLIIAYNFLEITNTIVNVKSISVSDLEKLLAVQVSADGLWINNIAASLALLLLTQYVYSNRNLFTNNRFFLF